ncbi:macro domain-containing protein [Anaeromyxobacter terrae]|uniref:peptidase M17 n=1 Tax=Anaeromyxobacter terrae TaxID=2925406 RepID=UPI001F571E3F|nr:peptidase M17 [Anaeromyxobacter sp. SG22]
MALKIEVADLGLPAIDALDVDAVGVFVGPERPLQGLAGFIDWRMCGAISRTIRNELFHAGRGEALLLPTGGRMAPGRLFCFGLPEVPLAPEAFLQAARGGLEALARAGSEAFAVAMPPLAGGDAALAARLWLEASLSRPVRRQVLLGDARQLQRELSTARNTLAVEVEVIAPPSRVEMPRRARALPHVGGVLR